MKIHVMGASCAGSTTLGQALSLQLNCPYFDTDHFFWLPTPNPFSERRNAAERNNLLKQQLSAHQNAIVGGSVINWGAEWMQMFDLVIFLYIPRDIRMKRLDARELERYGDALQNDPGRQEAYQKFRTWAYGYDDNSTQGRNLGAHKAWLDKLSCPVLEINGDLSVNERLAIVMDKITLLL
jgi:adenylate kinase family enzyme